MSLLLLVLLHPQAADLDGFASRVKPFLETHCVRCHGPKKQQGKLRLDTIDAALARGKDGETWKEVYDNLNLGQMPPGEEPRPAAADVDQVVAWIVAERRKAEQAARSTGGRNLLRRLNRTEYANTVRDLLQVDFLYEDGPLVLLPPDGTSDGFDKVARALMVDPSLMSTYLDMARRIADKAIVTGPQPVATKRVRFEYEDTAKSGAIGYQCHDPRFECREKDIVLMEGGARTWDHLHYDRQKFPHTIPVDGLYTIRLRMGGELGDRGEPLQVRMTWGQNEVVREWAIGRDDAAVRTYEFTLPLRLQGKGRDGPQVDLVNGTKFFTYNPLHGHFTRLEEKAGESGDFRTVKRVTALAKAEGGGSGSQPNPARRDPARLPRLILDWIEIEGPLYPQWPPASHVALIPEGRDEAAVRSVFAPLMARAFRRPVTEAEVSAVVDVVARERRAGESFEEAMKVGLQFVLCSPSFLYLFEPHAAPKARALDAFERASRLSYFLWSTMPDEVLLREAAAGRLGDPAAQVERMLSDPRSNALVEGFAAQWLQARKFAGITPNKQIYKDWDPKLEAAAKREPLAFFEELFRKDLSLLNCLDSGFAVINERLARHYGIEGVKGEEFRRVDLPPGSTRGGLPTMAGVLTIGSDGTRTLPVRRAVWILETLFNSPPPPPPPNAGEVEPNIKGKNLTVRERLLQHQKIPSCASCHRKIDGYGLALENYDAVGAWRERQNGEEFRNPDRAPKIESGGALPDGRTFSNPREFRALLVSEKDRFARAVSEKLLTYALGRSLEFTDAGTVDALAAQFRDGGYRFKALVHAVVRSEAFGTK